MALAEPPVEPTAEQPAEGSATEGLDDALASEVQSLMQQDFESVEQRLDNDSQEREEAAGSESGTAPGPSVPSAEAGAAISTQDEQPPAEAGSDEGVADPSSSTGEDVETDELNSFASEPAEGASPSPQAEESTPPKDDAATAADPQEPAEPVGQEPADPPTDPQSPPESGAQPDATSEAETACSDSSATTAAEPTAESVRPADTEALPQPHDSVGQAQEIGIESQDRAVEAIENASSDESGERPASPQTVETEVESLGSNAPGDHPSSEPLSLDEGAGQLDELLNVSTLAEPQKPGPTAEPQARSPATPGTWREPAVARLLGGGNRRTDRAKLQHAVVPRGGYSPGVFVAFGEAGLVEGVSLGAELEECPAVGGTDDDGAIDLQRPGCSKFIARHHDFSFGTRAAREEH